MRIKERDTRTAAAVFLEIRTIRERSEQTSVIGRNCSPSTTATAVAATAAAAAEEEEEVWCD